MKNKKHQYSSLNVGYYQAATNQLTVCGFDQGIDWVIGYYWGAVSSLGYCQDRLYYCSQCFCLFSVVDKNNKSILGVSCSGPCALPWYWLIVKLSML